jgi:hypothetical protein
MNYYLNLYRELHDFKKGLENNTVRRVEVSEETKGLKCMNWTRQLGSKIRKNVTSTARHLYKKQEDVTGSCQFRTI